MHFQTTVEIDAPQERVWATLIDVERWPEWTASIIKVERLDGRAMEPGARVRIKQPWMPTLVWEVIKLEPRESFSWRSVSTGVVTIGSHVVKPTSRSRVAVTLGIEQSGMLASIIGLLTSRATRRYVQMEALGLKQRCESV